ncbi:SDR family NAD(P)-dependent oxidoreductase [Streptomyces mesophilus]|uniref:SDR family NAD(P)-dependent oxidoreductase n=1 Tax=Streptomyces mesophilus TaxID=1775132 RepID=UPI002E292DC0|nr:SDR family NAD(P)-dependent oxidoreductase [Streptomyces mesophilus]
MVGVSSLLPGSTRTDGFWRDVMTGRDLMTDVPPTHWLPEDHYDPDPAAPDKTYARRGAFLDPVAYDPLAFGTPPNTLPATDTAQLLALVAAERVLADTGGKLSEAERERAGVMIGTCALKLLTHMAGRLERPVWHKALRASGFDEETARAACDRIAEHYVPWQEATFPGLLSNVVAGRIANRYDLHGTNCTMDAACASSLAALSAAVSELTLGRADLMLVGGVDTLNDPMMYLCFSKTPALSPTGDCRPFSDQADGTMLGEGLVMFALKRLADAERDGDRIYAVLRGIGTSSDGQGNAIYAPLSAGQARALRRTYEMAGYGPDTVELVEAHGTGTKAGDAAEFAALAEVFAASGRTDAQWCALGSVKSQIGHTKAAAGAAGLLKAVLALHHKVLPPTIKVDRPNPALGMAASPLYLNTAPRPWVRGPGHPRRASVSSFGFGGSNFHVTAEEYVPAEGTSDGRPAWRFRTAPTELVLLSAGSASALRQRAQELGGAGGHLPDVARRSQQEFRPTDAARLAVVAADLDELAARLDQADAAIARDPEGEFSLPGGSHYSGRPPQPGRTAFVFSGQGSQYTGMGAEVALHVPQALGAWDEAAAWPVGGRPLHDVVFPRPGFTPADEKAQQSLLTATEWAQPALAVQCLALLRVLSALGLEPDCVAGHSFGELVALHTAGAFDAETLVRLARRRGELMRDAGERPGAMLAVTGPARRADRLLTLLDHEEIWAANHNSPQQTVLSGTTDAIAEAERHAADAGLEVHRLGTATAFHSPLIAPAAEPFRAFLDDLQITAPRIPVYGNADADLYPEDPTAVRGRLGEHLVSPVRFADEIEAMYAAGVRTFLEVGAGAVLTGLVGQILGDRPHLAVSLDHKGRSGITSLHEALGRLSVAGVPLNFQELWAPYAPPRPEPDEKRNAMTTQILGVNHGKPNPPARAELELPPPAAAQSAGAPAGNQPEPRREPAAEYQEPAPEYVPADSAPPSTVPAGYAPPAPVTPDWFSTFQETQRRTGEVHAAYTHAMAQSHIAFMRTAEASLTGLTAVLGGASSTPVSPLPVPELSAPPEPVALPAPRIEPMPAPPVTHAYAAPEPGPYVTNGAAPAPAAAPAPPAPMPPPEALTPAPEPPAQAPAPTSAPGEGQSLEDALLGIVADLTGYPTDMLNTTMDLESDLGVDSIKRVQMLSKARTALPDLPPVDPAELGRLRTLGEIAARLGGAKREPAGGGSAGGAASEASDADPEGDPGRGLARLVPRCVPEPAPGLAPVGLQDEEVLVTPCDNAVTEPLVAALRRRGLTARAVDTVPSDTAAVIHLGGLAPAKDEMLDGVRDAFRVARTIAPRLAEQGGTFVTVQDTGGDFGTGADCGRPLLGGFAALARTAAREWPRATVRAIDCARGDRAPDAIAEQLAQELLTGGCDSDVGLRTDGGRTVLRATPVEGDTGPAGAYGGRLGPDSVIVVTGGARGVTAACLAELARTHRPRLVLLGRTPLPATPDPELATAQTEAALRALILERARAGGEPVTPAAVRAAVNAELAEREVRATLEVLEKAGSTARYHAVDATDETAVRAVLDEVRAQWGPVTGLVHAAGVLADKNIADKTQEQFERVFRTKVDGLRALLAAVADDPLDLLCVFSSVAAWAGNAGQCDYAMANETLEHLAVAERARRPDCLVKALAWGPWQGGMVRPELAAHFEERGIPLIPLADGARAFVAELDHGDPADVRVLLTPDAGTVTLDGDGTATAVTEVRFSRASHPQLTDHAVAGTPVVPLALAAEWCLRAGRATALTDLEVVRKISLDGPEDASHRLVVRAELPQGPVELRARDGGTHYRARISGESQPPAPPPEPAGLRPPALSTPYDDPVLFHGPLFQAVRTLHTVGPGGATATVVGAKALGWPDETWRSDPAAVDGCLQTALLWASQGLGRAVLPMGVRELRISGRKPASGALRCVVHAGPVRGDEAECDVFLTDDGHLSVALLGVQLITRPD